MILEIIVLMILLCCVLLSLLWVCVLSSNKDFYKLQRVWKNNGYDNKGCLIWAYGANELVRAVFGNGSNLSYNEYDESEGINDYIYISVYDIDTLVEIGGGMLDFNNNKENYYIDLDHFCRKSLNMVGYNKNAKYYVIGLY